MMAKAKQQQTEEPPVGERSRARRQQPTVRRQDLLAVTISCLARLGPKGTTGREICRQAGVSHGLLRHYFNNPENLLLETYEELCDHFLARFEAELLAPHADPWAALDRFFAVLFSEEWASSEVLGAWMAFWTLVRSNADFARTSDNYNRRLTALLETSLSRLPANAAAVLMADAVPILAAVMDGLWLDFCLSPSRLSRERAIALCGVTLRQLVPEKKKAT